MKWDRLAASKFFVIIAFSYLCKFALYRYVADLDTGLNMLQLVGAYTIMVGASILLTSMGCLGKHSRFTNLLIMLITDIWLVANIIYYKANFIYLDWQIILCAGNLHGFEDSIIAYVHWWLFIIPLLTLITSLVIFRNHEPIDLLSIHKANLLLISSLIISAIGLGTSKVGNIHFENEHPNHLSIDHDKNIFIQTHSPIGHLIYVLWEGVKDSVLHVKAILPLSEQEKVILSAIYTESGAPSQPKGHLVFLLVESWESWTLDAKDVNGHVVCENINAYIRSHHVLMCPHIITQQKYGRSGDGQLITQTGMLPVTTGVTCSKYGDNVYPNFAHFYPQSVVLNPYPGVWNQKQTTYSYGYKRLRETPRVIKGTDSLMLHWAREELEKATEPKCLLTITINTHVPFNSVKPTMVFDDTYSDIEKDYLQTVRYMDRQVGRFLAWSDTAGIMQNATIVLTADHNHFPRERDKGICPLIIKSPLIEATVLIPEAFQMDIFPTVLHSIGQTNYAWHGFGIDLLDSTAVRTISPEQAYALSDKMIRTNFFHSHKVQESQN